MTIVEENVKKFIDLIKTETEGNALWVTLSRRDIEDSGVSMHRTDEVLENLKEDKNILFKMVPKKSKTHLAPFEFKWTNDPNEKIALGLKTQQFSHLTNKDIEYVESKFEEKIETNYYEFLTIFKILNKLLSQGANSGWIKIELTKYAAITNTEKKEVYDLLKALEEKNLVLISKDNKNIILTLNQDIYQKALNERESGDLIFKDIKKRTKKETSKKTRKNSEEKIVKNNEEKIVKNNEEKIVKADSIVVPNIIETTISFDNGSNFKNIYESCQEVKNFVNSLSDIIKHVEENEKNLVTSTNIIDNLLLEKQNAESKYEIEKEKRKEKEQEIKKIREYLDKCNLNMQEQFMFLQGALGTLIDNFVRVQPYELKNPNYQNKFKASAWRLINDHLEAVVKYKPESDFPPDLK